MEHEKRKNGFPQLLGRPPVETEEVSAEDLMAEFDRRPEVPSVSEVSVQRAATTERDNEMTMAEDNIRDDVSEDLTEVDKQEIYEAIDLIRRKLSFAKDFSDEERSNLMRLGKTGRTFVEKAQNLVEREPGILPRSFDVEEFNRDADLYQELGNIFDELQRLTERVGDTEAAVGSDAFTASLMVYQSGKMARTGDDMDNHLAGWRRKIGDSVFD